MIICFHELSSQTVQHRPPMLATIDVGDKKVTQVVDFGHNILKKDDQLLNIFCPINYTVNYQVKVENLVTNAKTNLDGITESEPPPKRNIFLQYLSHILIYKANGTAQTDTYKRLDWHLSLSPCFRKYSDIPNCRSKLP